MDISNEYPLLVPQNSDNHFNEDLDMHWLNNMRSNNLIFIEPNVDTFTADKIRLFCRGLGQNDQVFSMAVAIVERYLNAAHELKWCIPDPFMTIITSIYLAGKLTGNLGDLKTNSLINLYERVSNRVVSNVFIQGYEIHVMKLLNFKLPMFTQLDDVLCIVRVFADPITTHRGIHELAAPVYCFYLIHRFDIIKTLRDTFADNVVSSRDFEELYTNRFYVPFAIVLSCFYILELPASVMDSETMGEHFGELADISAEHLYFLGHLIFDLWSEKTKLPDDSSEMDSSMSGQSLRSLSTPLTPRSPRTPSTPNSPPSSKSPPSSISSHSSPLPSLPPTPRTPSIPTLPPTPNSPTILKLSPEDPPHWMELERKLLVFRPFGGS